MKLTTKVLVAIWLAYPCATIAEDEDESSGSESGGEDDSDEATAAFEQAKALYKDKRFGEAATKFREANALRPTWKLFYNIGQSEAAARRSGLALEAFEKYLTLGGDDITDDRRAEVLEEIERLRPIVGFLELDAPAGSSVSVDDVARGDTPLPGPLPVAAGIEHRIRLEIPGRPAVERLAKVTGGQTVRIAVAAHDADEQDGSAESPVTPVEEKSGARKDDAQGQRSPLLPLGLAAIGVGAAVLIAGAATGAVALSKSADLDTGCPNQTCDDTSHNGLIDSVDRLSLATDILLPVGGTIAVAGIVMVVLGRKAGREKRQSNIEIHPYIARDLGGITIGGRF